MKLNKFKIGIYLMLIIIGLFFVDFNAKAGVLDFFYKTKEVLSVSGNNIKLNNQALILRGVAVGNPHSRQEVYWRTTKDYELIAEDWQANVVRLSIHPGVINRYEEEAKKILEKEVKAARGQGLAVIVDWHVIGWPNGWNKPMEWGDNSYLYFSSRFRAALDFWKYAAVEFRGDRGVMFELWNEPKDEKDKRDWAEIKPYIERLHDIIRAQGAENIIIAPGTWWTYDLRGIKESPLSGENIAYAWHNYPGNDSHLGVGWDKALDGLNEKHPIIVTEWGFSNEPSHQNQHFFSKLEVFPKQFKKYLLDKNLHFTAWAWHGVWTPNMLYADWQGLTDFGQFTKTFLNSFDVIKKVNDFIKYGVDYNTAKLGEGERRAVLYSFQQAFGRSVETEDDYDDIIKIASGHWPSQRSANAEAKAKASFRYVYLREPNMNNPHDNAAVTVMAYGLRQKAKNRNLSSERQALKIFGYIYHQMPQTTEGWNILQAIAYSGASR